LFVDLLVAFLAGLGADVLHPLGLFRFLFGGFRRDAGAQQGREDRKANPKGVNTRDIGDLLLVLFMLLSSLIWAILNTALR
jgi:hypothetical protein